MTRTLGPYVWGFLWGGLCGAANMWRYMGGRFPWERRR